MKPIMMRLSLGLLALSAACTTTGEDHDGGAGSSNRGHLNINGHAGYRRVQGSGWSGSEDQGVGGVSVDYTPRRWPIGFEGSLFASAREHERPGRDLSDTITDASVGLRKTVRLFHSPIRAYIGAGVTAISAEREQEAGAFRLVDDDDSAAWYGHLGAYWRIKNRFNLGIDARTTQNSELRIFSQNADADHWQVTVFFGWGW